MVTNEHEIEVYLKRLVRGLLQNDMTGAYQGYRFLYKAGPSVLPHASELILQNDWMHIKGRGKVRYFSGLFSLIRDVDEDYAKKLSSQIISQGCNQAVKSIINSLNKFSIKDYLSYDIKGIKVLEHKSLGTSQQVGMHLERWTTQVPEQDLQGIDRIYIIRDEGQKYSGQYHPVLNVITLTWHNKFSVSNPISWLIHLFIKYTFFHEVGHYYHRHTFGYDYQQEKEADVYASKHMSKSHPVFSLLIKSFKRMTNILKQ